MKRVYIDILVYVKKVRSSLFSGRSHTFILIHNNTHILKRKVKGFLRARRSSLVFPIYTNTNIHARFS